MQILNKDAPIICAECMSVEKKRNNLFCSERNMYDSYEKSLWREHEDVRGDDMVELGTAEQLLQEELCILGCWDDEVEE